MNKLTGSLLLAAILILSTGCAVLQNPAMTAKAKAELEKQRQDFALELWDRGIKATKESCARVLVDLSGMVSGSRSGQIGALGDAGETTFALSADGTLELMTGREGTVKALLDRPSTCEGAANERGG